MNDFTPNTAPLLIGATGGSGTRVLARLARHAGYDLGSNLNQSEDAMEFVPFLDRWINVVFARKENPTAACRPAEMTLDFRQALGRHLSGSGLSPESSPRWGWKEPRNIYLLPFFHEQFPTMKFIHLVRDGRDMAVSQNQNQLRKHGASVLTRWERWLSPQAVQSIRIWARVNLRATEYGEKELRDRYLLVRFEDLCSAPIETTSRILAFLTASGDAAALAKAEIFPPDSLGRRRAQPPKLIAQMERVAGEALRRFGYPTSG